jgi:hypothetical protein
MSTEELNARLEAAIEAANEGRTVDLGDFAQYAEEPAWKELRDKIAQALVDRLKRSTFIDPPPWGGVIGQPFAATEFDLADEVLAVILPHIQAAEERGRREALGALNLDELRELHANRRWHCGTCADAAGEAARWPCDTAKALGMDSS